MAIAAVMLMGSCSKNETVDTDVSANTPIGFSSYMGTTTKGVSLVDDAFLNFEVSAYHTAEAIAAGVAKTPHITAGAVTRIDAIVGTKWTSADYYWPLAGNLSFYAYSPAASATYAAATNTAMPTLAYTAVAEVATQIDVVVAETENQDCATAADVAMAFSHALTKINFSVTGAEAGYNYKVTSLKLTNVNSAGTYDFGANIWTATVPIEYTYLNSEIAAEGKITTALQAKERLVSEITRHRTSRHLQLMKDELTQLLTQFSHIKENKIDVVKNTKSQLVLKINAKLSH